MIEISRIEYEALKASILVLGEKLQRISLKKPPITYETIMETLMECGRSGDELVYIAKEMEVYE